MAIAYGLDRAGRWCWVQRCGRLKQLAICLESSFRQSAAKRNCLCPCRVSRLILWLHPSCWQNSLALKQVRWCFWQWKATICWWGRDCVVATSSGVVLNLQGFVAFHAVANILGAAHSKRGLALSGLVIKLESLRVPIRIAASIPVATKSTFWSFKSMHNCNCGCWVK